MGSRRSAYSIGRQWRELSKPTENESLVEALVRIATAGVRSVSPYRILLGRSWLGGSLPGDAYVLGWWILLIFAGVAVSVLGNTGVLAVVLVVALGRFVDILAIQTGVILVDHKRRDHFFQSIERSVLLAFNNVGQTILCFGLVGLTLSRLAPGWLEFATDCHNSSVSTCTGLIAPQSVVDYVYMSAGQLLTVGSKYVPVNAGAEVFHMVSVVMGLFLIALSIAFFVGGITSARGIRTE
jgi:hypothetical protein